MLGQNGVSEPIGESAEVHLTIGQRGGGGGRERCRACRKLPGGLLAVFHLDAVHAKRNQRSDGRDRKGRKAGATLHTFFHIELSADRARVPIGHLARLRVGQSHVESA
jgi:hypothetical protein